MNPRFDPTSNAYLEGVEGQPSPLLEIGTVRVWGVQGVPSASLGANGDFAVRSDGAAGGEYDNLPPRGGRMGGPDMLEVLEFDPNQEYGNTILGENYKSGGEYIDAIIQDAKKTLPPGTVYSFISWTESGKRKAGWVYNIQTEREKQKLFNPLTTELRT